MVLENIISATHTLHKIQELQILPPWQKQMKNYGNLFLKELLRVEGYFNQLDNETPEAVELYEDYFDVMKIISRVNIHRMDDLLKVLQAFEKEPAILTGICHNIIEEKPEES